MSMDKNTNDDSAIAVAKINSTQILNVTMITAISGIVGALIQGYFSSQHASEVKSQLEGLQTKLTSASKANEGLKQELDGPGASEVERKALYQYTTDAVEEDLRTTAGKDAAGQQEGVELDEVRYKRLKRSTFLRLNEMRANVVILENTLDQLEKRGHDWIAKLKPRLVAEFPEIKTLKLRWLEDQAIPSLEKSIADLAKTPVQSLPSAKVVFPKEIWILKHEPGAEPTMNVSNLVALRAEANLIKQSL